MTSRAPIRVAFVVHVMQVAGAEVLVRETIRRLGPTIEPIILCLDSVGRIGEMLQADGVALHAFGRRPGRDLGVAVRMARVLRDRQIEVVHAHQYTPFFYAALAGALAGFRPRIILTEHGRHFPDFVSPLRRAVNRLVFDRLASAVNAVCRFSADALSRVDGFSGARIDVIENGIDLSRYEGLPSRAVLRAEIGLALDRRYVVNVARLHPIKGQATLIRAFAVVARAMPDVDLLMVGEGPLRNELTALAAHERIADRVRFLGVRSDVPRLLRAADIFTLPSVCEAASLTLLEAMAAELPVVTTAVGGNPEIVRDGVEGLLVDRADVGGLADALIRLLKDGPLASRLAAAAHLRVRSGYLLEQTISAYARLYKRLARAERRQTPPT